jgi:cysteinyl-tRNA synthetase
MDLLFPHHECEIAQNVAGFGKPSVKYWMHNNMITVNGKKMGRSLGNFITLDQLFSGTHEMLEGAYSPMTIRFFILQAHYRSTLDFSNEALRASQKGLEKLLKAVEWIDKIKPADTSSISVRSLTTLCEDALRDDMNTPVLIAHLFDGVKMIRALTEGKERITTTDLDLLKSLYLTMVYEVLGIAPPTAEQAGSNLTGDLMEMILQLRDEAKANKDYPAADRIRKGLTRLGVTLKDHKEGTDWQID